MLIECLTFLTCFMTTFRSDVKCALACEEFASVGIFVTSFLHCSDYHVNHPGCMFNHSILWQRGYWRRVLSHSQNYNIQWKNNTQWDQRRWNFMIYSLIQHSTFVTTIKLGKLLYLMLNHHANIIWDIIWSDKSKCNK